jgi:tryptophanyl-tRNA synthetase
MSKSYGNIIDIFLPDKELLKQIKGIKTDSTPMESPKNPDTDNVFAIYSLLGDDQEIENLRSKYLAGNFGYGHAKQELFDLVKRKYAKQREAYNFYMSNPSELEAQLLRGEEKARVIAREVLERVRKKVGFR